MDLSMYSIYHNIEYILNIFYNILIAKKRENKYNWNCVIWMLKNTANIFFSLLNMVLLFFGQKILE